MNLLSSLKDVELPEVKITVNEDVYRNLFLTLFLAGSALIVVWVVIKKAA